MSAAESLIDKSERLMSQVKLCDFEPVLEEMATWPTHDKVNRRMIGHIKGKIELVKGNHHRAIQLFNETIANEGSHVLILADLVACYYMSKQYSSWKFAVEQLDQEIKPIGKILNLTNKNRVEIILAKSLELQGSIKESYQKYLSLYQSKNLTFKIKGLCNLVRLEAQFPLSEDFSKHYLALKQFTFNNEQADYDSDVAHSLLLAEAEHIDIQLAIKTLSKIPRSQTCYFALGYYELLDLWLRKDKNAFLLLQKQFGTVQPESVSDEKLLLLAKQQTPSDWYTWSHSMPFSQYFRLVRFILNNLDSNDQALCRAQVQLMLKGFSNESRALWLLFFQRDQVVIENKSSNLSIQFDDLRGNIIINDISIELGKQNLLKNLLALVLKHREINFDQVCLALWSCGFNESYNYRIRDLVNRINSITKKEALTDILYIIGDKVKIIS